MAEDSPNNEEETGTADEKAPEGQPAARPQKKQQVLICSNLKAVGRWVNYLGDYTLLQFAQPVKAADGKVLVQQDTLLRETIFQRLQSRKKEELPPSFVFKYSREFKEACKKLVSKRLYMCLEPGRFHIAPQMLKYCNRDYRLIGNWLFENREVLDLFISMDMDEDPILPHLGEVALVSAGFAEQYCRLTNRKENTAEIIKTAYIAGLLHDISLQDDWDFLVKDLEQAKESHHEGHSADFITANLPSLDTTIARIVADHHRVDTPWAGDSENRPGMSSLEIVKECLAFTEYFYGELRMSYRPVKAEGTNLEGLNKVFFNIGQAFGNGMFHPALFKVLIKFQAHFTNVLQYGQDIGLLERKCINHKPVAVAYPTPRCTQVLCRDSVWDCRLINGNSTINVVTPSRSAGFVEKNIKKGQYPKCRLSEQLPKIPPELNAT